MVFTDSKGRSDRWYLDMLKISLALLWLMRRWRQPASSLRVAPLTRQCWGVLPSSSSSLSCTCEAQQGRGGRMAGSQESDGAMCIRTATKQASGSLNWSVAQRPSRTHLVQQALP